MPFFRHNRVSLRFTLRSVEKNYPIFGRSLIVLLAWFLCKDSDVRLSALFLVVWTCVWVGEVIISVHICSNDLLRLANAWYLISFWGRESHRSRYQRFQIAIQNMNMVDHWHFHFKPVASMIIIAYMVNAPWNSCVVSCIEYMRLVINSCGLLRIITGIYWCAFHYKCSASELAKCITCNACCFGPSHGLFTYHCTIFIACHILLQFTALTSHSSLIFRRVCQIQFFRRTYSFPSVSILLHEFLCTEYGRFGPFVRLSTISLHFSIVSPPFNGQQH